MTDSDHSSLLSALRADLALVEQIPLCELDGVEGFTLDMHMAFGRLTEAIPKMLAALERAEQVAARQREALERIEAMWQPHRGLNTVHDRIRDIARAVLAEEAPAGAGGAGAA